MGFRNSISQVTVSGPVQLAAGGVVGLAGGSLVGVSGPSSVTTPAAADLLASVTGRTGDWSSPIITLTDSYEAVVVVVSNGGLSGTSQYSLGYVHTSASFVFPAANDATVHVSPGSAEQRVFPLFAVVGDTIQASVTHIGLSPSFAAYVYGIRRLVPGLRKDGRLPAAGTLAATATISAVGTTAVVAAPTAPTRILVASGLFFPGQAGAAITPVQIAATVNGVVQRLGFQWLPAAGYGTPQQIPVPAGGLLCDPGTALNLAIGGATALANAATCDLAYDLVT